MTTLQNAITVDPTQENQQRPPLKSRLILGDCIDKLKELPDESIDLVVTDPPYLVRYKGKDGRTLLNDDNRKWLYPAFREVQRVLKKDSFVVSFYGYTKVQHFMRAWMSVNLYPVGHFVCVKDYASRASFTAISHECAYLLAKGKPIEPKHVPNSVQEMRYSGNKLHPTQKHTALLKTFIQAYSRPGDVILDPFAGSGSTAVAAKSLGRECIAIEKDPTYFKLAKQRLLKTDA